MAGPSKTVTEVGGRRLTLSNLDKVLYPDVGFTKAAVIDYYARIAPVMLPHLARRGVTMVRWPNGVEEGSFFEKRCPPHAPDWVVRAALDEDLVACVVDDVATLVWMANLAALELHTLQATVDDPGHPTAMVVDLDPGPPAGLVDCCRVALDVREILGRFGLRTVVKTSGGKGLHLAAPVRGATADQTKGFARALGQLLAKHDPERVTINMAKDVRSGRVFVDWSQNDRHKTTVCAYSLRARSRPMVSAPLGWDEVEDAQKRGDAGGLAFDSAAVLERVDRLGDHLIPNDGLVEVIALADPAAVFTDLQVPMRVVTTDVVTGDEILIVGGELRPALLASAALPGIFPPVDLHGHTLVDGAVVNLVPISHALAGPTERIFVLDVSDPISERPLRSPLDMVVRAFAISRDLRFDLELQWVPKEIELVVLPPPRDDRDFFDFSGGQELIDQAYRSATAALDDLEERPGRQRWRRWWRRVAS